MNPAGVIYAFLASCIWGVVPIFWRAVAEIPPVELIAQRVIWTATFSVLLLVLAGRIREVIGTLAKPLLTIRILIGACLICGNWVLFVWAVVTDHVLDASLGYYLNPLVSVMLGMLVLGERLSGLQAVSVGLAVLGVASLIGQYGGLPWISLGLGVSFGLYGLLHKLSDVNPIARITIESTLLAPVALWFLFTQRPDATSFLGTSDSTTAVLVLLTGPVTVAPLVLFGSAARRLPLTSLGLFQYMGPTITFLLAVYGFGESFTTAHAIAFGCIWVALTLHTLDSFRRRPAPV